MKNNELQSALDALPIVTLINTAKINKAAIPSLYLALKELTSKIKIKNAGKLTEGCVYFNCGDMIIQINDEIMYRIIDGEESLKDEIRWELKQTMDGSEYRNEDDFKEAVYKKTKEAFRTYDLEDYAANNIGLWEEVEL